MRSDQKQTHSFEVSGINRPDRRLAKTRSSLVQALLALMQTRNWDDISIFDICTAADVARSSFYAHFDNKSTLLDQCIMLSLAEAQQTTGKLSSPYAFVSWTIEHVTTNKKMFNQVSRNSGAQVVLHRFKAALITQLEGELVKHGHSTPQLAANFVMGGVFDTLIAWSAGWNMKELPRVKSSILKMASAVFNTGQ